jgi:hypothetical protein
MRLHRLMAAAPGRKVFSGNPVSRIIRLIRR